ncbi:MAG TPA: hypothetical protein VFS21_04890 [Roseiflexaceae bacterium]|nr:hypothetical protein [Roseiflexaceae bacterium]
MFGAIILRDIPKEEVRIDIARVQIQGGFRGFSTVPPGVWHYVSVKDGDVYAGFWCRLEPGTAVVKVFDGRGFQDDTPENLQRYSQLALGGSMGSALGRYPLEMTARWVAMVGKLPAAGFPPALHPREDGGGSRFALAFQGTHGGDERAFLAEFQWAFVSWYLSQAEGRADEEAHARWRHLLLACYNAGEHQIRDSGTLFGDLADTLTAQMTLLPDSWFAPDSFLVAQAGYMAEDMQDSGIDLLVEKGRTFAAYLAERNA